MAARNDTIYVKNLVAGQETLIKTVSAGAYTMTFAVVPGTSSATLHWMYQIAPTITTTAGRWDNIYLSYDGTDYNGEYSQNH